MGCFCRCKQKRYNGVAIYNTKNKNDTDIKLKDIEKEIVSIKSNLEKEIVSIKSNLEKKIVESKNVLLQWILGMITGYTILLIVVLRFFEK